MHFGRSLPLDGGGAGVGVFASRLRDMALEAPPKPFRPRPALTPIPAPSPIEGEGGRYAIALGRGQLTFTKAPLRRSVTSSPTTGTSFITPKSLRRIMPSASKPTV